MDHVKWSPADGEVQASHIPLRIGLDRGTKNGKPTSDLASTLGALVSNDVIITLYWNLKILRNRTINNDVFPIPWYVRSIGWKSIIDLESNPLDLNSGCPLVAKIFREMSHKLWIMRFFGKATLTVSLPISKKIRYCADKKNKAWNKVYSNDYVIQ